MGPNISWMDTVNLAATVIFSPDSLARSESLYRLHYAEPRSGISCKLNQHRQPLQSKSNLTIIRVGSAVLTEIGIARSKAIDAEDDEPNRVIYRWNGRQRD